MTTLYSFGYKMNGEDQFATTGPMAPLVIDCRELWNPHVAGAALRKLSGLDKEIQERFANNPQAAAQRQQAISHAQWADPAVIAFGCAYGKHRSVAQAELTAEFLRSLGMTVMVVHTGAVAKRIGLVVR